MFIGRQGEMLTNLIHGEILRIYFIIKVKLSTKMGLSLVHLPSII